MAVAQSPPREEAAAAVAEPRGPDGANLASAAKVTEWIVGAGAAKSVELFHSRGGIRYAVQTLTWSRDLSGDHGPGVLRGRWAWAVEVMAA